MNPDKQQAQLLPLPLQATAAAAEAAVATAAIRRKTPLKGKGGDKGKQPPWLSWQG